LRQVGVLDRAEHGRLASHEKQNEQQQGVALGNEGGCRQDHQYDFQCLDATDQHRLFVLVCQLPGGRRKQEKGQNKQAGRHVRQLCMVHASNQDALKRDQDHEAVAENIVVEGAEELGREEWREAPLA